MKKCSLPFWLRLPVFSPSKIACASIKRLSRMAMQTLSKGSSGHWIVVHRGVACICPERAIRPTVTPINRYHTLALGFTSSTGQWRHEDNCSQWLAVQSSPSHNRTGQPRITPPIRNVGLRSCQHRLAPPFIWQDRAIGYKYCHWPEPKQLQNLRLSVTVRTLCYLRGKLLLENIHCKYHEPVSMFLQHT